MRVRTLLNRMLTGLSKQPRLREGLFVDRSYSNNLGKRNYKVYIPKGYRGIPMPAVVMLHGCTQSPEDFAAGTCMNDLADRAGFVVIYPAQCVAANGLKCWSWFNAKDQVREGSEPSLIAAITMEAAAEFAVDRQRIFIAGLSAGAAMAVILGATYPDLFSAVGAHSGLPYRAARSVMSALAAMRGEPLEHSNLDADSVAQLGSFPDSAAMPTIVFHGDQDATVSIGNGAAIVEQAVDRFANRLVPLRTTHEQGSANGREFTASTFFDPRERPMVAHWVIHGAGHAWSGGSSKGSYSDSQGPDASAEMVRFFFAQESRRGKLQIWRPRIRAVEIGAMISP